MSRSTLVLGIAVLMQLPDTTVAAPEAESAPIVLDTQNPDILKLAREADDGLDGTPLENDFHNSPGKPNNGLNPRNLRGLYMSTGLSLFPTNNPSFPDYGFSLLEGIDGDWGADDFTSQEGSDLFFYNPVEKNRNHGLASMSWDFAPVFLKFQGGFNQIGTYTNDLGFSVPLSHFQSELYKRLELPRTPGDLSWGSPGDSAVEADYKEIDANASKLIVVIHGWSSSPVANPFSDEDAPLWALLGGDELNGLMDVLHAEVSDRGLGWDLYGYHWARDSWTGGALGLDSHEFGGIGTGVENGTQAAEIGFQHGLTLGKQIKELYESNGVPLEKIHFIAHSAGTWVARSASLYLEGAIVDGGGQPPQQQITLLDPYNPAAGIRDWKGPGGEESVLGYKGGTESVSQIESWSTSLSPGSRFENIYAIDAFVSGTNEVYGGNFVNAEVGIGLGLNFDLITTWNGHGGPINYYAATVDFDYLDYGLRTLVFGSSVWTEVFRSEGLPQFEDSLFWQDVLANESDSPDGRQFVSSRTTSANDGDSDWHSAVVDIDGHMVRVLLLPNDGGPGLPLGPSRLRSDWSFSLAGPNGLSLAGAINTSVDPYEIQLSLNGSPFGSASSEVGGPSVVAGAASTVDENGTRVYSIALKDDRIVVAVEGFQMDGSEWGASGLGAVDPGGGFVATNGTGFSLSGTVGDGGTIEDGAPSVTPPPGVAVVPGDFDRWMAAHGVPEGEDRSPLGDPDRDGVVSWFEFYRNSSPVSGTQGGLFEWESGENTGDAPWVRYRRSLTANYGATDLYWSPDLIRWARMDEEIDGLGVDWEREVVGEGGGTVDFRLRIRRRDGGGQVYLRLENPDITEGQILLVEDWETGVIDPLAWHSFGSPAPKVVGASSTGFSMESDGDDNFESGLVTQEEFLVAPGLEVSFKLHVEDAFWSVERAYLTEGAISDFPAAGADGEPSTTNLGPAIQLVGYSPWGQKIGLSDPGGLIVIPPLLDQWVELGMRLEEDGSVSYFVNGVEAHRTPPGWVNYAANTRVRLVLRGRSPSGVNRYDDIVVSGASE